MPAQLRKTSADALIASLATRAHGVVSRKGLLAAGVSRQEIETRLQDCRLQPLHRGIYLVGAVASQHAYAQAALLACGEDSVLSHRSAAHIWGLRPYSERAYPWVTVPREIDRPKIVVRRAVICEADVRVKHGLRVVSPPRAVLDCATVFEDPYELEALIAEAHFRRLAFESELREQVERNAGRPGVAALRAVLDIEGGPQRTRSGGERWFLRLLRENGIDGFEANGRIAGFEVDFLWRDRMFCVELDGWDGHSSRGAFEADRVKWATLQASGWTVMPIAVRQAQRDEAGTVGRLQKALSLHPSR